jgi:predicted MPP superfamily phosphohydrolase
MPNIKYKIIEKFFNLKPFIKKKNIDTFKTHLNKIKISINNNELKGLKILFISDLHIDITPENIESVIFLLKNIEYDYCFLGGDYMEKSSSLNNNHFSSLFAKLLKKLDRKKTYAVLGNHDDETTLKFIENYGITVLSNDSVLLDYKKTEFLCYGVAFYDVEFENIKNNNNVFSILLSHTPDNFINAKNNNFNIQLSGHTHNGQIQFPFGFTPVKNTNFGNKLLNGVWHSEQLTGYTSSGLGCSAIPIRYGTQSEIALIELT